MIQFQICKNTDSFKLQYPSTVGAIDYRLRQVGINTVKYAGQVHDTSKKPVISSPSLEIEWNGLVPGMTYQFILDAVDCLGPSPRCNLYDVSLKHLFPDLDDMSSDMGIGCMLGANKGLTGDGYVSINGQGPADNQPNVLWSSPMFSVTLDPVDSFAGCGAFDDFASASITKLVDSPALVKYSLVTPVQEWEVEQRNCHSLTSIMVENRHLMDVTFDGPDRPASAMHTQYGVTSFSPHVPAVIELDHLCHVSWEVDAHLDSRRSIVVALVPSYDPLVSWQLTNQRINRDNEATFITVDDHKYGVTQCIGNDGKKAPPLRVPIVGAVGQAPRSALRKVNGRGIDNRSRFDLVFSTSKFWLFEDGILVTQDNFRVFLTSILKIYFAHYVYHTALELKELSLYAPYETYWQDVVPFSDERHWDRMGYQVVPDSTPLQLLVSPFEFVPLVLSDQPVPQTQPVT